MNIIEGDLLSAFERGEVDAISHQTNCKGVMGSGIAKQIRERMPEAFLAYVDFCKKHPLEIDRLGRSCYGMTEFGPVFNLFGQFDFGRDGKRYTNYEAVARSLEETACFLQEMGIKKIGFPYQFGCGLGGGNWEIVSTLIKEFIEKKGILTVIYKYGK